MRRSRMVLSVAVLAALAVSPVHAAVTKGRRLKTGQATSYGSGSDGDLQVGLSRMYKDLGNGVVKDQRTGLFWEKKSDDGSIHDKDDLYTWGQTVIPYAMNGTMTSFIAALNTPPCFADFCDWRVPNLEELESIRNMDTYAPSAFPAFHAGCTAGCTVTSCSCTVSSGYWTSSTYQVTPDYAWYASFYAGSAGIDAKASGYYVRAVRGGSDRKSTRLNSSH